MMKSKMLSIMLVVLMALLFTGISVGGWDVITTQSLSTDSTISALEIYNGATLTQTAGTLTIQDEYAHIGGEDEIGIGTYEISGGTFTVDLDNGGDAIYIHSAGTFRIIGDGGTINTGGVKGDGTIELVMNRTGISAINCDWSDDGVPNLVVNLDDYAVVGLSDMTLYNIAGKNTGTQGAFATFTNVSVTKDGSALSVGTGLNQYSIDYNAGTGNDVVLSVNVPEPATMSLLALGGLAMLRRRRRA